ncbi:hypothetical protein KCU93_g8696, partial [Aureobasidium melanogenum]
MAQPQVPQQDVDLWKVYANKIKEQFLSGNTLGETNKLFIPLLNSCAPMVGSGVTATTTSYEIGNIGDSLITYNNPMFTTAGDKYSRKVSDYLYNVQLKAQGGAGNLQNLEVARKEVLRKQEDFDRAEQSAMDKFDKVSKNSPSKEFSAWVTQGYPYLSVARSDLEGAQTNYDMQAGIVFGAGYKPLQADKDNMKQVLYTQGPTQYNMEVSPPLFGVDVKSTGKRYMPLYTIDSSYETAVQDWIRTYNDLDRDKVKIQFSSSDSNKYSWSTVGHQEWKANASVKYVPFLSIDYNTSGSKDTKEVHMDDRDASVDVTIAASGIQTFTINSGAWDIGDVKKKYPNLLPGASKSLWDPMYRVTHLVVGYGVSLDIKMNKSLYDKVTKQLKDAQSHDGGASATFFGFKVDIGARGSYSSENQTDFSNIATNDDACSIHVPGSNNTIPTLLAVLATEVAPANQPVPANGH